MDSFIEIYTFHLDWLRKELKCHLSDHSWNIRRQCGTYVYKQGHIDMIEKVQRRATRYVMGKYRNISSEGDMLEHLERKSLETRRREARLCMMYKIVSTKVAIDPANYFTQPIRRSRHMYQHAFAVPSATKDSRKWSFFCNTVRDWNSLQPDIAAAKSLGAFKSQVTKTH